MKGLNYYIVAYDITDDRRRNRLFKALKGFGIPVQYSLFECRLHQEAYLRMQRALIRIINPDEDKAVIVRLSDEPERHITRLGNHQRTVLDERVIIV